MKKGTRVCVKHRFEPTAPSEKKKYGNWQQFNEGVGKCGLLLDDGGPGSWDVVDVRLAHTKQVVTAYSWQLARQSVRRPRPTRARTPWR
jgi:hypothetical protein